MVGTETIVHVSENTTKQTIFRDMGMSLLTGQAHGTKATDHWGRQAFFPWLICNIDMVMDNDEIMTMLNFQFVENQ